MRKSLNWWCMKCCVLLFANSFAGPFISSRNCSLLQNRKRMCLPTKSFTITCVKTSNSLLWTSAMSTEQSSSGDCWKGCWQWRVSTCGVGEWSMRTTALKTWQEWTWQWCWCRTCNACTWNGKVLLGSMKTTKAWSCPKSPSVRLKLSAMTSQRNSKISTLFSRGEEKSKQSTHTSSTAAAKTIGNVNLMIARKAGIMFHISISSNSQ